MLKGRSVVAVSQKIYYDEARQETWDALDQKLEAWLSSMLLLPFPVPNSLSSSELIDWILRLSPNGIVLSGGNDIGENKKRDQTERLLIDFAEKNSLPLVGICRGMQMVAQYFGSEIVTVEGHVKTRHALDSINGKELPLRVNSFHNLGIPEVYSPLRATAMSEDGFVEAADHTSLPWELFMWHPEREEIYDKRHTKHIFNLLTGA